ncbi:U6 snRNA-associated Sm-like protein LSm7 [Ceratocystis lukuohia]|uniref:U6 snRNA-associated Sm-like protein LSm7 n=3 Tax=Ceratocystis TaxID=5157 RepID=A0A0F8BSU6_CERFI|nr:U6 snRNA-associated Sm-like protein LSm7 [Ceratocystis platani]PHH51117.1 U6 snRNA-associated Sm-like protein LSm7 [Ceratocystis fimbriata CBS 114723]
MADRGNHTRGGGRGGYRGDYRGGRGGSGGGRGGGGYHHGDREQQPREQKKRDNILDLAKYMDKSIRVKFTGGREVVGTLKGYDALMNLVLDEAKETMSDENGNETERQLGLLVARGTLLVLVSPLDGSEAIENPFLSEE